jgi:hypothetical protein
VGRGQAQDVMDRQKLSKVQEGYQEQNPKHPSGGFRSLEHNPDPFIPKNYHPERYG